MEHQKQSQKTPSSDTGKASKDSQMQKKQGESVGGKRENKGRTRNVEKEKDVNKVRPFKINAKETYLYVIIPEQCSDKSKLEPFLHYRMGNKDASTMKFCLTDLMPVRLSNKSCSLVTLRFESSKKAAAATNLLHKSNQNSSSKIRCYSSKFEALGEKDPVDAERACVLEEAFKEIVETASRTALKHDEKLTKARDNLKEIEMVLGKEKGLSPAEFEKLTNEKLAVEDKFLELERQRREFNGFIQNMKTKLNGIIHFEKFDKELKEIRKYFGVECRRLDAALPMYARRTDILNTIRDSQVSVILGETGSGKSTQMAQYLYQAGFLSGGFIACTQPRKIAAVSLATRVASELSSGVGQVVGYKVGMQSKTTAVTKIVYMTDHILLNECLVDTHLSKYSCVIIDEAHERSIYTDLLLGMLKQTLSKRPELKVVITSATIDPDLFVTYFGGMEKCPVLKVSGRTFPVDVIWDGNNSETPFPDDYMNKALNKAIEIHNSSSTEDGDILVFLTSPAETETCAGKMKRCVKENNVLCLQLHGKLKPEEQQQVFAQTPSGKRKVVFATNSAETSITIPGIKFVVDAGVVKEMRFDAKKNMNSLDVVPVSQSSSNQRKGRAGRTESGKCFRLYTDDDFCTMEKTASPEILRIQVSQAMLKLILLGVDPMNFDYVQSPSREAMVSAMEELEEIGAAADRTITELGRWIAKLPVEPKLGAFIKKGIDRGFPIEVLVVAGCSSQSGIFYRAGTAEEKKTADMRKMKFCHNDGDFLTALNVFREWDKINEKAKGRWCTENSVNGKAMKGVREMMNEILSTLKKEFDFNIKHKFQPPDDADGVVKQLVFDCMMNNLAIYLGHESAGYLIVKRMQRVQLHPGSALVSLGSHPEWVVFNRVLKTSADFMTEVTAVSLSTIKEAVKSKRISIDINELEKQKIRLVLNMRLGKTVFWKFVGKNHSNRRKIEGDIQTKCNQTPVVIEANKLLGVVSLFCLPEYAEQASGILRSILENMVLQILAESREESIGNRNSGVRVVLREGGSVVDLLMPNQFRTLTIKVRGSSSMAEKNVRDVLEGFGSIANIWKRKGYGPVWGSVTFAESNDAAAALSMINKDENRKIDLIPVTFENKASIGRDSRNQSFTIVITWCRRKAKGLCFVTLKRPEDKAMLSTASAIINGSTLSVRLSKTQSDASKAQSDLFIKGLRPDTTEEHVKEGLGQLLGVSLEDSNTRFGNIIIPRTDMPWSQDQNAQTQREISGLIQRFAGTDSFKVNVKEFKQKTVKCIAFVTFSDWKTCFDTGERLRGNSQIDGSIVHARFECKANVFVAKRIFEIIREDMEQLIDKYKQKKSSTTVTSRQMKNENYCIEIKTLTPEKLAKGKCKVEKLVNGDTLDCEKISKLEAIFNHDGRLKLKEIADKTGTIIFVDERRKKVIVQGSSEGKTNAVSMIENLIGAIEILAEKVVRFKGKDNPPGLLKVLLRKYGMMFEKLKVETGVSSIHLNIRYHEVTLTGKEEAIERALIQISKVRETMIQEGEHKTADSDFPDCPVCLCPVEETDISRLEYCGHSYCKFCLTSQIQSAITNREFPIACAEETCNKPVAIRDLDAQVKGGNVTWEDISGASIACLVTRNTEHFKYCITPDCGIVYRATEEVNMFACPVCNIKICTSCHNQFHEGLTCKENESAGTEDTSLEEWLKEEPNLRKLCPKCGYAIEKISGCNRMTCKCGANICWKCLAFFETSGKCYDHLSKMHGGCFDY
ncbi:uncharacterized protein LOC123554063 [Mercenaria mercenaria]|uniref:uncharacterized protein LOC123554063 n=1 Tax=Mercenaria mercenaria TaxID=6596 RepID=UPI00234EF5FB|nr:uncharacterized protein LOC123554063 [Mercenaria mercenaria]XP_045199873.2 uncharacterized protein LOC123554063 [Mercenaria mercenaria]XP_045199875.2 uncharacterized protein LOC123554063 [Mercenaria mercenaria]XP_053404495.1 uncharacterized protein LOC123554063 [Mercenaria mercenaria]